MHIYIYIYIYINKHYTFIITSLWFLQLFWTWNQTQWETPVDSSDARDQRPKVTTRRSKWCLPESSPKVMSACWGIWWNIAWKKSHQLALPCSSIQKTQFLPNMMHFWATNPTKASLHDQLPLKNRFHLAPKTIGMGSLRHKALPKAEWSRVAMAAVSVCGWRLRVSAVVAGF